MSKNALNWFEIPVSNMDRAVRFYEGVLGIALKRGDDGGRPMAVFPAPEPAVAGALVADPHRKPTGEGSLVYLDATEKLDACLARVSGAGGEVVLPSTSIGANGFIGLIRDPEGNVVGLHSYR